QNARLYRAAFCPNCGCTNLGMERVPETPGDHVLVNKNVFDFRRPRRWEMVVFRCPCDPGKAFVKRVVGLPGEKLRIRDGDIYINGALARKTLGEFKAMRIPVFDNNYQPGTEGFRDRWESRPPLAGKSPLHGTELRLLGHGRQDRYQSLVYRNYSLDDHQLQPLCDEYAYNGGEGGPPNAVHDFMLECDLKVEGGRGSIRLGITDGANRVLAEIPVGHDSPASAFGGACLREAQQRFDDHSPAATAMVYRHDPDFRLHAGRT